MKPKFCTGSSASSLQKNLLSHLNMLKLAFKVKLTLMVRIGANQLFSLSLRDHWLRRRLSRILSARQRNLRLIYARNSLTRTLCNSMWSQDLNSATYWCPCPSDYLNLKWRRYLSPIWRLTTVATLNTRRFLRLICSWSLREKWFSLDNWKSPHHARESVCLIQVFFRPKKRALLTKRELWLRICFSSMTMKS